MKKERYEATVLEIIRFMSEDVIMTSNPDTTDDSSSEEMPLL